MIIGIHGLENKPPKEILSNWWIESINEGINRNHAKQLPFSFELTYWADTCYPQPTPNEQQEEPYLPSPFLGSGPLERFTSSFLKKGRNIFNSVFGSVIDTVKDMVNLDEQVEEIFGRKLPDLGKYYMNLELREKIRGKLKDQLLANNASKICLIAHSMGSIIAYDTLRELEKTHDLEIEHFITIGSPLGLPFISSQIRHKFGLALQTPENVKRWTNIADPHDKVALDVNLGDEYKPNSKGIKVEDILVVNDYKNHKGEENPHKIYGYLRNPEMSDLIIDFLEKNA